jgi:hypothetical protein
LHGETSQEIRPHGLHVGLPGGASAGTRVFFIKEQNRQFAHSKKWPRHAALEYARC